MYILKKKDLKPLLILWARKFEVFTPQIEDGQVMLLPFDENRFTMNYINFSFPVKEYLFKQRDIMFSWKINNGNISIETPDEIACSQKVYFGVRPCDAYGIAYMDKFYLEGYYDKFYGRNRDNAFIAAVNCTETGKDCFCSSMGTGPFADKGYDMLFTPVDDMYLVEAGSKKGNELLAASGDFFVESNEDLSRQKDIIKKDVLNKFKTFINSDDTGRVLEKNYNNPIWQKLSNQCVACTGCTTMCPTCTCFNMVEKKTGPDSGSRVRCWDSCQSDSFTRNAGEHNPRDTVTRVKYRIYDKFKYIEDKFGFKGCTGCGRCINVCPASINVVNIINKLAEDKGDE